jgi:uncharacterized protein
MTWMQTISGMLVDLLDPKSEQILLGDIAHALARIPRFNGHTVGDWPWNVAQHSLLVESLMPAETDASGRLVALLHDAHEAYVGDLITPVKQTMNAVPRNHAEGPPSYAFTFLTERLDAAIWQAFGLNPSWDTLDKVKTADLLALAIEKELLMAPARDWGALPKLLDPMPVLRPEQPFMACELFIRRFHALQIERHGLGGNGS